MGRSKIGPDDWVTTGSHGDGGCMDRIVTLEQLVGDGRLEYEKGGDAISNVKYSVIRSRNRLATEL
jgi:hypothetical protein